MNCISFSIFGYNKTHKDSFSFASYLRGFSLNMRMSELIYPSWKIHLVVDRDTYNSQYKGFFDYHREKDKIDLKIVDKGDLCMLMIKRMIPIFTDKYDRVICRDSDSLVTYRERQAVEYWIKTGRAVHAITDSISHNVALMGGMAGFMCKEFKDLIGKDTWSGFMEHAYKIDFSVKGADQTYLNKFILPLVKDSMCEHYCLGLPQSFRGECYNYIQDEPIQDIKPELKENNLLVEHIGQAGFIVDPVLKFLDKHQTEQQKEYYSEIDLQFKDIHYWLL